MRAIGETRKRWRADARELLASERACDTLVFAYALWTLLCNALVFAGGGLIALLAASAVGLVAAAAALRWLRAGPPVEAPQRSSEKRATPGAFELRVALGALAIALAVALLGAFGHATLAWVAAVVTLALAFVREWNGDRAPAPREVRRPAWETLLWAAAALVALVPVFFHRRSLDDAFYLNVAVAAVDAPHSPLLAFDTLYGIERMPLLLPVYRVNSYELLGAALSYLSGLPLIAVAHVLVPVLLAPFVVLAWARLCRRLAPDAWIHLLAAVLAVLLSVADTTEFWSNFAFLRLQQGKCAFLSLLVPLLVVYGQRFADAPGLRRWLLLSAAQIAGLGMTSTALWVAPTIAALALAARLRPDARGLRTLGAGLAASAYPLALALVLRGESAVAVEGFGAIPGAAQLFAHQVAYMLGTGPVALASVIAATSAWSLVHDPLARRLCVVFPLGVLLLLLNPFLAEPLARNLTGAPTYYRVFWVLPMPAFLGLVLTAPLSFRLARPLRFGAAAILVAAFVALAPRIHLLSPQNFVTLEPFGLAVPAAEFRAARALTERVPPRSQVLAPEPVSIWIGTLHGHPYPLVPRVHYLRIQHRHFTPSDFQARLELSQYVEGRSRAPTSAALLAEAARRYDLAGVALVSRLGWADEIRTVLAEQGFRASWSDSPYEVWVRGAPAP